MACAQSLHIKITQAASYCSRAQHHAWAVRFRRFCVRWLPGFPAWIISKLSKQKKNINFNSYKLRALILYRVEEGGVRPPSNAHIFIWFERKIINATQLYNKIFKILIRVPMLIGKFRTIIILITKKVKHS